MRRSARAVTPRPRATAETRQCRAGRAFDPDHASTIDRVVALLPTTAPDLGRWLASGLALLTVAMLQLWRGARSGHGGLRSVRSRTGQQFEPALNQLDLRLSKRIIMGAGKRVAINVDLYNVFNQDWAYGQNNTLGTDYTISSTWLRPTQVLAARMFKIGGQVDF